MFSTTSANSFEFVQTWLTPWGLRHCVRAVLGRNLSNPNLLESKRWSHYPAGPTCSINCMFSGGAEITAPGQVMDSSAPRKRLPALSVTGPQSQARSVFHTGAAQGVMIILYPDAWSLLTGQSALALNDQVLDAHEIMPPELLALCQGLLIPGRVQSRMERFFEGLQSIWPQVVMQREGATWRQAMGPWMEALALRAAATGWGRSLRQSERRVKQWTGWSLRQLQGSVRGEAAFLAIVEAMLDERLNWSQIALDNGFSDQSHFIRETRRLTGFSPQALRQGFLEDEAFWVYRAWARLAGYAVPGDFDSMR